MSFPLPLRAVLSSTFGIALGLALTAGCSSSSGGSSVSFATDVLPILQSGSNGCQACHSAAGGTQSNLDLSGNAAQVMARLVNVAPTGAGNAADPCSASAVPAGTKLVVPSNSAKSLLYNKLNAAVSGSPAAFCGMSMPLGGGAIASGDLAMIKTWIDNGAAP